MQWLLRLPRPEQLWLLSFNDLFRVGRAAPMLTIGELARRAGVRPATVRMWESRYAFPDSTRSAGGQRRYDEEVVEQVRRVLERRNRGLSLPAAIEQVRTSTPTRTASLFAALTEIRPELQAHLLSKRAMIRLSRAVEDEAFARAGGTLLLGSFQREAHYRRSESRWRELSRTAEAAFVLADFAEPSPRRRRPAEIPVDPDHPMRREWAVVVYGPQFAACLTAWEVPGRGTGRFEVRWTAERAAVRQVLITASMLITGRLAEIRGAMERIDSAVTDDAGAADAALVQRMIGYLGAAVR